MARGAGGRKTGQATRKTRLIALGQIAKCKKSKKLSHSLGKDMREEGRRAVLRKPGTINRGKETQSYPGTTH